MKAIYKTKTLYSICFLFLLFGACISKKQLQNNNSTALAIDTTNHQTAFQSLKPKTYNYPNFKYQLHNIPTPKPNIISTRDLYEFAFENLNAMLEEKDSVDFEKAIFITENVFYSNKVKYDDYLRVLDFHTKRINALIAANDKSASLDFKVYANFRERGLSYTSLRYTETEKRELYRKALTNWAIFTYLTDTLTFGLKQQLPFAYQIKDPFGMDNWSNSQVLNLLGSMEKMGNCFALVALFKIFSNRLNSEAYICIAPQHIYLQHRNEKGDFYNLELATKTYPSDGTLMTLTFTHKEAIMSGISLRRLKTDKQNIALCLVNLGKSYEHKFETRENEFMLKCAELALKYDSLNLNAMLLKQQVLEERVMKFIKDKRLTSIVMLKNNETFKQLEKHTLHLYEKGYHQMPLYMQEIILSKLSQDNKPIVLKDRTPNPYTNIKVPAKNKRYSTLSGGLYEEVHAQKQFEEYGYFVLDTKNRKLVQFTKNNSKKLLIDPVVFAWSVDPMAHERTSWTPYNAFRNNPIINIDPTGALDGWYEGEDNEMHFDKDVHNQKDIEAKGLKGSYKFEEGKIKKGKDIETYHLDGSAFFTNETRGYQFMWNNSTQNGKPIENQGFLTKQGVMVLPTEGITFTGDKFKNEPREANWQVYPYYLTQGAMTINFHGKNYSVIGSIHTHPDYNIIPYHSGSDVSILNWQKIPMFVIHKSLIWTMTPGTTGPYEIGSTKSYLNGTRKIIPYINKF